MNKKPLRGLFFLYPFKHLNAQESKNAIARFSHMYISGSSSR